MLHIFVVYYCLASSALLFCLFISPLSPFAGTLASLLFLFILFPEPSYTLLQFPFFLPFTMASHRLIRELPAIISMLLAIRSLLDNFIASLIDLDRKNRRDHHPTATLRQEKPLNRPPVSRGYHRSTRTFRPPVSHFSGQTSAPTDMQTFFRHS